MFGVKGRLGLGGLLLSGATAVIRRCAGWYSSEESILQWMKPAVGSPEELWAVEATVSSGSVPLEAGTTGAWRHGACCSAVKKLK